MTDMDSIVVDESASLKSVMRTIDINGRGIVFVTDEDRRLIGAVTDGDIRRGLLEGTAIERPITTVMNDDPISVHEDWSRSEIREHARQSNVQNLVPPGDSVVLPVLDDRDRIVDCVVTDGTGSVIEQTEQAADPIDRVLVIGGAGYLGSTLSELLLEKGYEVRVLDNLIVGRSGINHLLQRDDFELVEGDMRSVETIVDAIKQVDAVVHLAGLVGDPASAVDPQTTLELNYHSVKMTADICKYHQINRFVFASTCSVYGRSPEPESVLTEQSPLNPVSLYARSNLEAENALLDLADRNFSPTILRMATLYGLSPRMRFDLVVNILSAKAATEQTIPIFGGDQYRPNLHVRDAARAYIACIEAPIEDVSGEIFNVGSTEENYQIREIGEIISEQFPQAEIDIQEDKEDDRSYQVDFTKFTQRLGYETKHTIADAANEIKERFEAGEFEKYTDSQYNNYQTVEEQLSGQQQ